MPHLKSECKNQIPYSTNNMIYNIFMTRFFSEKAERYVREIRYICIVLFCTVKIDPSNRINHLLSNYDEKGNQIQPCLP